jgi:hypothetical protein
MFEAHVVLALTCLWQAAAAPTYADAPFNLVLSRHLAGGMVDYAGWRTRPESMQALEGFLAVIGRTGPHKTPMHFQELQAKKAYYITAYNAWVIKGVLDEWPIQSVMDVKHGLFSWLKKGAGFFYGRTIVVDGEETHLYNLENDIIRKLGDPRVHFAINCASKACPALRAVSWTDAMLEQATRDFMAQPHSVTVTSDAIVLSSIFDWYAADFAASGHVLDYVMRYSNGARATELSAARARSLPIRFARWDWEINAQPSATVGP